VPQIRVTPAEVRKAKFEAARNKGTGSFFADILGAPLLKRPALSKAVAKYRQGLTNMDVRAGEIAGKIPGVGKLFSDTIRTPVKTVGKIEAVHVQNVKRLSAPLVKAQKFLVPIFAFEGLRRLAAGHGKEEPEKGASEAMMTRDEQAVLMKAAAVIEKLGKEREYLIDQLANAMHEKQAHTIAADMADKGMVAREDVEKKAAELALEPDLGIVKKAVDLSQRGFELGRLEKTAQLEDGSEGEMDPLTEMLVNHIRGR
jgi:hypothetical protein